MGEILLDEVDPSDLSRNELADRTERLEEEIRELREDLYETKKTLFAKINQIEDRLEDGGGAMDHPSHLTVLEKYQRLPTEERERLLSASKRRAVLIFEHWRDWAEHVNAGWLITTRQSRDRRNGKSNIKADLKASTGEDLRSIEVYRAMKMVAKLSAKDPDREVDHTVDEYDREHVTGGAFEYHDKVRRDADRSFKVLKLVEPDDIIVP